jgi:hypothetical protein
MSPGAPTRARARSSSKKIVERMGREFYSEVFQPAIQNAWDGGQRYEDIRDTLRKQWNEHGA